MGNGHPITRLLGDPDGFERLGDGADLIELDENGIGHPPLDALLQDTRIGHEQVVAHELQPTTETTAEQHPAVPVVLRHAVLDRHDRITLGPRFEQPRESLGVEAAPFGG